MLSQSFGDRLVRIFKDCMSATILIVDDDPVQRRLLEGAVAKFGHEPVAVDSGAAALDVLGGRRGQDVRVMVLDLLMPGMDGLEVLERMRAEAIDIPVVVQTAKGSIDTVVAAMRAGAFDFVVKPASPERLRTAIANAMKLEAVEGEVRQRREKAARPLSFKDIVTNSPAMARVMRLAEKAAASDIPVLIEGESGVGKELIAQAIRTASRRRSKPFVTVNCGAIPDNLVESILFGHEKGAFTGADRLRKGRFELADGGTLLLDEISEIAPQIQAKLLRVLQERAFERVGSSLTQRTDVRVIATTNRDLQASVAAGAFRQDLFFRLNVLPLHVPALRERCEDVPLLCDHFLGLVARREGRPSKRFDDRALAVLRSYAWPGNVRELYNVCERASIFTPGEVIDATTIAPWLNVAVPAMPRVAPVIRGSFPQRRETTSIATPSAASNQAVYAPIVDGPALESHGGLPEHANSRVGDGTGNGALAPTLIDPKIHIATIGRPLEDIERDVIVATLQRHNGHRQRTARELQIGIRTLGLKLRKWKDLKLVSEDL